MHFIVKSSVFESIKCINDVHHVWKQIGFFPYKAFDADERVKDKNRESYIRRRNWIKSTVEFNIFLWSLAYACAKSQ